MYLTMEDSTLIRISAYIRDELASLQDQAPKEMSGHIVNPVAGLPYAQNTGCAALVFATEHCRTNDSTWMFRAQKAVTALKRQSIHIGLDEPKWYRPGWENHRGSLFATGTLLDSYWRTLDLLGQQDDEQGMLQLLNYLSSCLIKPGLFAHDSIQPGHVPAAVQNTSAIALYLMEMVALQLGNNVDPILKQRDITLHFLLKGQRKDGFWPYIYPGTKQQLVYQSRGLRGLVLYTPYIRRYFFKHGDESIYFGDAVHHCLVLHYLAKSIDLRRSTLAWEQTLSTAWKWTREHLIETEYSGLRFDFDWEPIPHFFRWGNFRDTSTYFLILATLPILTRLSIIAESECKKVANGILIHIEKRLLDGQRFATSISPYEGADHIIRFILPRVGEASAWKGALLSEFALNHCNPEHV